MESYEELMKLPRTPKEAWHAKSPIYFNGKPCKEGHLAPRYESGKGCVVCHKLRSKVQVRKMDPEKSKAYLKSYRLKNQEKITEQRRKRRASDPLYALQCRVRSLVWHGFNNKSLKKGTKTAKILGCTWAELASHIEKQFLPGMTWENKGEWHIDHIVPIATAKTEADVIALNHFTNLRPMWADDNLKKNAKITHLI